MRVGFVTFVGEDGLSAGFLADPGQDLFGFAAADDEVMAELGEAFTKGFDGFEEKGEPGGTDIGAGVKGVFENKKREDGFRAFNGVVEEAVLSEIRRSRRNQWMTVFNPEFFRGAVFSGPLPRRCQQIRRG